MEEEVKLLGFWSSPFVHRVIWTLKLKGIRYEYIEQDRFNKSELLLQSNPIYKKVPVLVHGDKAIAESLVILEYIEETWPHIPLLPTDLYDRAISRFWLKFSEDVAMKSIVEAFMRDFKDEEEKAEALKKAFETLKVLEEQGLGDKKFFGGDNVGLVDICYGILLWLQGYEEIVGTKLIEPTNLPHLHAWLQRFKEIPVIKENFPDYDKLLLHLQWRREGTISGSYSSYPIQSFTGKKE